MKRKKTYVRKKMWGVPGFCHLSWHTHERCKWNLLINTSSLIYFIGDFRLFWSFSYTSRNTVKIPGVYENSAGPPLSLQARWTACLQSGAIWNAEQSLALYLTEWPQLPCQVCVAHTVPLYEPRDGISMRSARYVFPQVASGSRIGYVNGPAAG